MNVSLLVLALWLSSALAPESPTKVPSPIVEPTVNKYPTPSPEKWVPKEAPKLPAKTIAAKLNWKPGSYSAESLKLPAQLPIEQFDAWNQGPGWPQIDGGVVVVIDNPKDPHRFLAYMVDVKAQRVAAVRDGDKGKHLMIIGQQQVPQPAESHPPGGFIPPSIMQLAGSGAVIILRPPPPPGPNGVPDDLIAKILDAATIAAQAGAWMAGAP